MQAYGRLICRRFSTRVRVQDEARKLRIAIIGQSQFGADVYRVLREQNHNVVGVFTVPDVRGRPDPLAMAAEDDGVKVHKYTRWRKQGAVVQDILENYKSIDCELNVLPFCTQFIPMDIINHPKHQSICYHPSLLPKHRGASAINWTLINGDREAGFTIFWADDGLDTGPILLQRSCPVEPNDTVDSLYNRFLYPEGVKAMAEAVQLVASGNAQRIPQTEKGASYDPMMKKDVAELQFNLSTEEMHNFIRGNDRTPGAWMRVSGEMVSVFGSRVYDANADRTIKSAREVDVKGMERKALVHDKGMLLFSNKDDSCVNVSMVWPEGSKMMPASKFGSEENCGSAEELVLDENEVKMVDSLKQIWAGILGLADASVITPDADFFKLGAGSMEVVRLVEEIRSRCSEKAALKAEDVYMASSFAELSKVVVSAARGLSSEKSEKYSKYDPVLLTVGNRKLRFPHQIFISNEFVDASDGGTFDTINPTDESVICSVAKATKADVDKAVDAAKKAFVGEWSKMNARDRGKLMYRLADLLEENKEDLAALESVDSGAVYTLALKTHIGMSIDTFRYFAGWTDKIQGKTIPVNHARPAKNLTYTKREPIGVCGIVTPWNYPLMMLAWKMSPCLAAGNTVVLKPAQVTPLTALKFAELSGQAGFPPGVINILPGSGAVAGQALVEHPDVRKLGFTGSTAVGKTIMSSCAGSNLKKVSLELGGKSPLIIFSDCDMDRAVRFACSSVFFNKGENCIAAGRLFVEEAVHDQFVARVVGEIKKMKIGDPLNTSTDHGPQNHKAHLLSLLEYCDSGVKEGATLVYGGKRVDRPGYFLHPTVFTNVSDGMFIAKEESFGPVMIISKFANGDVDDVVARANATEYGLASGVFTRDVSKALRIVDGLHAGTVFVNTYNKTDVATPFGGFKQSGFGKDLGEEALSEYLQTKAITIEY